MPPNLTILSSGFVLFRIHLDVLFAKNIYLDRCVRKYKVRSFFFKQSELHNTKCIGRKIPRIRKPPHSWEKLEIFVTFLNPKYSITNFDQRIKWHHLAIEDSAAPHYHKVKCCLFWKKCWPRDINLETFRFQFKSELIRICSTTVSASTLMHDL